MLIDTCFWCLKPFDKNIEFDKEKDTMCFKGYKPCPTCNELFSKGIQVLGVSKEQTIPNQPAMTVDKDNNSLYPTGRMFLAPIEWVMEFLADEPDTLAEVIKHKVLLLPDHVVEQALSELDKTDSGFVEDEDLIQKQQNAKIYTDERGFLQ